MTDRLLDRQASLLAHLTSSAAIFGDGDAPADQCLAGMQPALLRLEAKFSHRKRMEKIAAVLPRTFRLLGASLDSIVREFTESCPPTEIGRLANVRQFYAVLARRWSHTSSQPPLLPYLPDVAALEFAFAEARREERSDPPEQKAARALRATPARLVRCDPALRLVRCAYDVRALFEAVRPVAAAPIKRDTHLAISLHPDGEQVQVIELSPAIFELLASLQAWDDMSKLGPPTALTALLQELASRGLIEVRT